MVGKSVTHLENFISNPRIVSEMSGSTNLARWITYMLGRQRNVCVLNHTIYYLVILPILPSSPSVRLMSTLFYDLSFAGKYNKLHCACCLCSAVLAVSLLHLAFPMPLQPYDAGRRGITRRCFI